MENKEFYEKMAGVLNGLTEEQKEQARASARDSLRWHGDDGGFRLWSTPS